MPRPCRSWSRSAGAGSRGSSRTPPFSRRRKTTSPVSSAASSPPPASIFSGSIGSSHRPSGFFLFVPNVPEYCSRLEGDESYSCWRAYFELKDLEVSINSSGPLVCPETTLFSALKTPNLPSVASNCRRRCSKRTWRSS